MDITFWNDVLSNWFFNSLTTVWLLNFWIMSQIWTWIHQSCSLLYSLYSDTIRYSSIVQAAYFWNDISFLKYHSCSENVMLLLCLGISLVMNWYCLLATSATTLPQQKDPSVAFTAFTCRERQRASRKCNQKFGNYRTTLPFFTNRLPLLLLV